MSDLFLFLFWLVILVGGWYLIGLVLALVAQIPDWLDGKIDIALRRENGFIMSDWKWAWMGPIMLIMVGIEFEPYFQPSVQYIKVRLIKLWGRLPKLPTVPVRLTLVKRRTADPIASKPNV
jgi:hypothetical protein